MLNIFKVFFILKVFIKVEGQPNTVRLDWVQLKNSPDSKGSSKSKGFVFGDPWPLTNGW